MWKDPSVDLFVPMWTWHNRSAYDADKIQDYTEYPLGAGLGVSSRSGDESRHAYLLVFQDSHADYQGTWGYAWERMLAGEDGGFKFSAGWTLSVHHRRQYNYFPIPLPLPLVGAGYEKVSVQATYVPGWRNMGNVLFMWARVNFGE